MLIGLMFTLFLRASLPVPSIFTLYLLFVASASHIVPDDVHLPLSFPLMLCSTTAWPTLRGAWSLVWASHLFPSLLIFSRKASSLSSADSWKVFCIMYLPSSIESFICSRPRICLPKSICAGVLSTSLIGVFLYSSIAACAFSSFSLWFPPSAERRILFMDFTPVSALMLACGLYALVILCCTPHAFMNSCVSCAVNCGPPSDTIVIGIPYVVNILTRQSFSSDDVPPLLHASTIGHEEKPSTTSRYTLPAR